MHSELGLINWQNNANEVDIYGKSKGIKCQTCARKYIEAERKRSEACVKRVRRKGKVITFEVLGKYRESAILVHPCC